MPLGRRRQEFRKLAQAAKAKSKGEPAAKPPKEVILDNAAPPRKPAPAGDTETGLPALKGGVDPNAETEAAFGTEPAIPVDAVEQPMPPEKLPFECPCGAKLTAPRAAYDKKTSCPKCGGKLLLNLIADPHGGPYRIEPFRT
jgi:hypothetical protein